MNRTVPNQMDYLQRRLRLIIALGGKCCCGQSELRKLDIHHVDGGGTKERKDSGGGAGAMRKMLQKELEHIGEHGHPTGRLKVLCFECHATERNAAIDKLRFTTLQTRNMLGKISRDELYRLVETGEIEGEPVADGKKRNRYQFKAQEILKYVLKQQR